MVWPRRMLVDSRGCELRWMDGRSEVWGQAVPDGLAWSMWASRGGILVVGG
jgi:hypothetical protein